MQERDAAHTSLTVKVRLINGETLEIQEQDVFMGDFPLMTEKGTFIYNGGRGAIIYLLMRRTVVRVILTSRIISFYSSTIIPLKEHGSVETDSAAFYT